MRHAPHLLLCAALSATYACAEDPIAPDRQGPDAGAGDASQDASNAEPDADAAAGDGGDEPGHFNPPDCADPEQCRFSHVITPGTQSCALREDRTLWCWGNSREAPTRMDLRLSEVKALRSQGFHASLVEGDGTVWMLDGQRFAPVFRATELEQAVIAPRFSCGILSGGRATCWETDAHGFPKGPFAYTPPPGTEALEATALVQNAHSGCLLTSEGEVHCWDIFGDEQDDAPDAGLRDITWPALKIELPFVARSIALASTQLYAIADTGELYGFSRSTQAGNGQPAFSTGGVPLVQGSFAQVVSGAQHSCALRSDGALFCWGANSHGQVGAVGEANVTEPTQVGEASSWTQVSLGPSHTCATNTLGEVFCWGSNRYAELGKRSVGFIAQPMALAGDMRFVELAHGEGGGCAIRDDGALVCWGPSSLALPEGTSIEPSVIGSARDWTHVWLGLKRGCGLRAGTDLWCWGENSYGVLGGNASSSTPSQAFVGSQYRQLSIGENTLCGVSADGALSCTGRNTWGAFGTISPEQSAIPVPVYPELKFKQVLVHELYVSALATDGTLWTWGQPTEPVLRTELGTGFQSVADGSNSHGCGIKAEGKLYCWGDNMWGQVGHGGAATGQPTAVDAKRSYAQVALAQGKTCGLTPEGELYCWGYLGNVTSSADTAISLPMGVLPDYRFKRIALAKLNQCALTTEGELLCWGSNNAYTIGDYQTFFAEPQRVPLR